MANPTGHRGEVVFARVYPPRPLDPAALEALLVRLASDPTHALVVFEARSRASGTTTAGTATAGSEVSYWLGSTAEHLRWLRRTSHDLLPGLVVDTTPAVARDPVSAAARVKIRPRALALAVDRPEEISTAILSALNQHLLAGEGLVLQLVFGPRRTPRRHRGALADPNQPWWQYATTGVAEAPAPVVKQHDQRALQAGMATCVRFGIRSGPGTDRQRQGRLLTGLLGGTSTAKAPGTFMRLRPENPEHLNRAEAPLLWEFSPAAAELVGLLGWPLGDGELPGLPPLHPKVLPVPPGLARLRDPRRVLGLSTTPGDQRPIGLSATDGLFHLICTGPTGSGKSTALLRLIHADIQAGRPVVVIDPKRQLIDDVVTRAIPEHRVADVVLLDPSDPRVPGFNPLDVGDRDPDVVVDGLLAVFAAVFHDGWGPRTQDITHAGLLTLARVGQAKTRTGGQPFTLLDLPKLFADAAFRRPVIGHVASDEGLGSFWAAWEAQSPGAQAAALAAPSNKWRQYLMRPSVRRILGQPSPKLRLRDVFQGSRIVLVPLNDGLIGPITAQLLGGLIVAETWAATLERASEQNPTSRPASVWVDEVQNYLHLPTSLDDALAASRSLGVSWNLAHQFRAQMPPAMLAATDFNASNKLVFRPKDPKDATAYARMVPDLEALDFMALGLYESYATLVAGGAQQPLCSLRTLPPPDPTGLGDQVRQASRMRYGTTEADRTTGRSAKTPSDGIPDSAEPLVGRKRTGGRP